MSTRQTARSLSRLLSVGLLASGVLAACGGGDSTAPVVTPSVTQHLNIVPANGTIAGLNGKTLSLAPGDTARLSGVLADSRGGSQPASGLTWTSATATVADVDGSGLIRGRANGTTTVIARASQYADTLTVVVSACGTGTALSLAVGQVQSFAAGQGASLCIPSASAAAEYAIVAFNADSADLRGRSVSANIAIAVSGSATLASQVDQLEAAALSLSRSAGPSFGLGVIGGAELQRDAGFDARIRATASRTLAPRMSDARAAVRTPRASGLRLSTAAAVPTVGQLLSLNASLEACDTTSVTGLNRRTGRVVAISDKAIVVADTLNPAGGFTTADYQGFGIAFDTLAYPVDVANFGSETDVDKNGRSIIFFTSAVNEMTPTSASYYVGGFFYERDLFPNNVPEKQGGCGGSNNAEMFYMLVPDPNGSIHNNKFRKGFVDSVTVGTLGHEFQHLINAGRRLYVNDADNWEDTWLNEGLSHIAEELVFYKASGTAPRSRLDATGIRAAKTTLDGFNSYQNGNFGRLISFLGASEGSSPYADNDDLETRGATWQFLRYAADRVNGTDATLWKKLVSTTKLNGMQNLQAALGLNGATMGDWFNDWSVANYADGLVGSLDPRFAYRSWNFRSVVGSYKTRSGQAAYPSYPIVSHTLADATGQSASVRGGAAAYFRVAVAANGSSRITVSGGSGAAMPGTVRLSAVRVK